MNRILNTPDVATAPRSLAAVPARFDEVTQQAIDNAARQAADQARQEAYDRGRRDAAAEQTAAARQALEQVSQAIAPPVMAAVEQLRGLRQDRVQADVELSLAIAEAVLGHQPDPDAVELAAMVRSAVAYLDEPRLAVHVHPSIAEQLTDALGARLDGAELAINADPTCPPGEAQVIGRWGRADVSRRQALDSVRAVLAEHLGTPEGAPDGTLDGASEGARHGTPAGARNGTPQDSATTSEEPADG